MLNLGLVALSAVLMPVQDGSQSTQARLSDLRWMVGTFSGQMQMTMGEGNTSTAELEMKGALKSQFIELEYTWQVEGLPDKITEKGFLGWDAETGQYRMWTFTSRYASPRIENGRFEGGALRTLSEPWATAGPEKTVSSNELRPVEGGIRFTLEIKVDSGFRTVGSTVLMKRTSA